VATGEHVQNRIIFKQLLQAEAIQFCQIDACRLGGVNEVLAVLLMAAKFGVPVCPHAGGVGLCEYVQHLSMLDYICIGASLDGRVIEFVDHLHEHFVDPVRMQNGCYMPPELPGYSIEIKPASLDHYAYPHGAAWQG
jgi:L-fuconate dehydratase